MGLFSRSSKTSGGSAVSKLRFLSQYTLGEGKIEMLTSGDAGSLPMPSQWRSIVDQDRAADRVGAALALRRGFMGLRTPATVRYLEGNLEDVELMRVGEYSYLLYSVRNGAGEILYYAGGNPLERDFGDNATLAGMWERVPDSLRAFCEDFHEGFYYFPSRDGGLDALRYVLRLGAVDWSVIPELDVEVRIDLDTSFGFFANGSGGYVVLDLSQPSLDNACVWWAHEPPSYGVGFWPEVDGWIAAGLE
ncbi:MAG: hypothetical protein LBJ02_08255 [Bifidobacteriaceae bacterium]|jgi:hypothetical protein|nr:hypothetical protein [Bifidobacteriaceae bacterium]